MLTDRYDPVDLFALVPQLSLQMEPELARLDRLLEDDILFEEIKADLAQRYPQTLVRGRHSTPVEVILRMLVVKRLYGFSYEQTEYFVSDSLVLRQFCRLGFHRAPDDTTLLRWANQIAPATVARINERVVALARELKVTRGRKLRVDATLVETNIHYPTDASLLVDAVRVLARLLGRARKGTTVGEELGAETFVSHERGARKWAQVIYRLVRPVKKEQAKQEEAKQGGARRDAGGTAGEDAGTGTAGKAGKGAPEGAGGALPGGAETSGPNSAKERMKEAYGRLLAVTRASVRQARQVSAALREQPGPAAEKLREPLAAFVGRAQRVIEQTHRRVMEGATVPACEKVVSLFEEHTQIVNRGKPSRPVEFGRKVQLEELEGGIVSGYRVLPEPGADAPYLKAALEQHQEQFGKAPELLAADRGYSSPANERRARDAGVKRVVIPATGKVPSERKQQEKARWFRRGYRFRAGSEGRISVLKRRFGLRRCLEHGEAGMERWVGWGVVTSNLLQIARATAGA